MHGAADRASLYIAGALPLKKIGDDAIEDRRDESRGLPKRPLRPLAQDRNLQELRHLRMGKSVDVRQMQTKQMVEHRLVVRVELVAVPPEPVAPFGGIEFVPRLPDRLGRHVAGALPLLQEAPGRS